MTARLWPGFAGTFVLALAVGLPDAGLGAQSSTVASRTIDRTVICRMTGTGFPDPLRFMDASATPFDHDHNYSPRASVSNGVGRSTAGAGVSTGPGLDPTGLVWLSAACTTTKLRIALSSKGLKRRGGGPRDFYRCDVPATVLIRVRAVFKRPAALARDQRAPGAYVARGDILTGDLAVTAVRGRKPIFFGSVNGGTGRARVFIAPSRCALRR